jgi:hypothetical protein
LVSGNIYCVNCLRLYTGYFAPLGAIVAGVGLVKVARLPTVGGSSGHSPGWFSRPWIEFLVLFILGMAFAYPGEGQGKIPDEPLMPLIITVLAVLLVPWLARRSARWAGIHWRTPVGQVGLALIVGAGILATPFPGLSGSSIPVADMLAGSDIAEIEEIAQVLAKHTSPEDRIFFLAETHPLLYLPDRHVPPAMANHKFGYMISDDVDGLQRWGLWNYELGRRWLSESDVVVVSEFVRGAMVKTFPGRPGAGKDLMELLDRTLATDFELVAHIPAPARYRSGAIDVYRRIQVAVA